MGVQVSQACQAIGFGERDDDGFAQSMLVDADGQPIPPKISLKVGMVGVRGLHAGTSSSAQRIGVSCSCEIPSKSVTYSKTPDVVSENGEVTWNFQVDIKDYNPGDSLVFGVHSADLADGNGLFGRATLTSDRFHLAGFGGELPLEGPEPDNNAALKVSVLVSTAECVGVHSSRSQLLVAALRKVEEAGIDYIADLPQDEYKRLNKEFKSELMAALGEEQFSLFKAGYTEFRESLAEAGFTDFKQTISDEELARDNPGSLRELSRAVSKCADVAMRVFASTSVRGAVGDAQAAKILCDLILLVPERLPRHQLHKSFVQTLKGEEDAAVMARAMLTTAMSDAQVDADARAKAAAVAAANPEGMPEENAARHRLHAKLLSSVLKGVDEAGLDYVTTLGVVAYSERNKLFKNSMQDVLGVEQCSIFRSHYMAFCQEAVEASDLQDAEVAEKIKSSATRSFAEKSLHVFVRAQELVGEKRITELLSELIVLYPEDALRRRLHQEFVHLQGREEEEAARYEAAAEAAVQEAAAQAAADSHLRAAQAQRAEAEAAEAAAAAALAHGEEAAGATRRAAEARAAEAMERTAAEAAETRAAQAHAAEVALEREAQRIELEQRTPERQTQFAGSSSSSPIGSGGGLAIVAQSSPGSGSRSPLRPPRGRHQVAQGVGSNTRRQGDPGNLRVAAALASLGAAYRDMGRLDEALDQNKKALEVRLSTAGERHPDTAISYSNVGAVLRLQGRLDEAYEYYRKALEIREEAYSYNHPDTAASYTNIGAVHLQRGDLDEALEAYLRALEISKDCFQELHAETAARFNDVGAVLEKQGQLDKALDHLWQSLNIQTQLFGDRHQGVADSYNNVGAVLWQQGKLDEALGHHGKALDIRLDVLGDRHPDTALSYGNVGVIHEQQGRYQEAVDHQSRALEIRRAVLGEKHAETAASHINLAIAREQMLQYQEALDHYRSALGILEETVGSSHPWSAQARNHVRRCDGARLASRR